MKIRHGYVSNSSSSSFIVGVKEGKLTVEHLMEAFQVPESSPMSGIARDFAETMYNLSNEVTEEGLRDDYCYDESISLEEMAGRGVKAAKLMLKGYKVYQGWASDEGTDGAENYLCRTAINYEGDTVYVCSDGGY